MQVKFSGAAHVVRPKGNIKQYIGQEVGYARRYTPEVEVKVWQQEFPFDNRCDEAVVLYGADLKKAGEEAQGWNFKQAYDYAAKLLNNTPVQVDASLNEGPLELGKTENRSRAAKYTYPTGYVG